MSKSISQFLPLIGQSREDADRHYRRAHTRFARAQLRAMPHVLTYQTNRAEAEYDIAGGWSQRPRAFRFVILRFEPGRSLDFPPDVRERVAQDHRLFLRELRGFAVEEEVLVDRLSRQTALVKYLFEYERPRGSLPPDFHPVLDALAVTVREQADAFGLRQVLLNRVRAEAAADPIDEPGQRPTSRALPETAKHAFLEIYFDHHDWAEEWFTRSAVRTALFDPRWGLARGYRVSEECGLDRRPVD